MVKGYSRVRIALHWALAGLIIHQLIFGEDMGRAWRAVRNSAAPDMTVAVWAHIVVGVTVLALVMWRLTLRLKRGVPAAPEGESRLVKLAGTLGHGGLYALMIVAPVSGLLAWYGGVATMAEVHSWLKPALILLIAVHIAAALYHQFIVKDGLMNRMRKPLD